MEILIKQVIKVDRKTESFECKICKKIVNPNLGKPVIYETDKEIIHGWDYGHMHKRVFQIIGGKQYVIEGDAY